MRSAGLIAVCLAVGCSSANPLFELLPGETSGATDTGAVTGGRPTVGTDDGSAGGVGDSPTSGAHTSAVTDTGDTSDTTPATTAVRDTGVEDTGIADTGEAGPVCCEATATPGCDASVEVEDCVCNDEPYCCDQQWDALCVLMAAECNDCTFDCCSAGPNGGCNEQPIQDCVCEIRPACCDGEWSADCVGIAAESCEAACDTGAGGCCLVHGPGCDDLETQAQVCALDPFCCMSQWDMLCVEAATEQGACEQGVADTCCVPHEEPGCIDWFGGLGVQACVCDALPACCATQWGEPCVQQAGECLLAAGWAGCE